MKRQVAVAVLALFIASCNGRGGPAAKAPEDASGAKVPAPALDPKYLINDEKIGRFITYQQEMSKVAALAVGATLEALQESDGNTKEIEKAMSRDERMKKVSDAEASAIAKSGLTTAEATEMANIISSYTPGMTIGDDEMKQQTREEFTAKYGAAILAVLDRHLKELSDLQDLMLKATLGGAQQ